MTVEPPQSFTISRHALERALDMCLDPEQIRETLNSPRTRDFANGRWYLTRGKVTAVVVPDGDLLLVTTFTWASAAAWVADAELAPLPAGRDVSGRQKSRRQREFTRRR